MKRAHLEILLPFILFLLLFLAGVSSEAAHTHKKKIETEVHRVLEGWKNTKQSLPFPLEHPWFIHIGILDNRGVLTYYTRHEGTRDFPSSDSLWGPEVIERIRREGKKLQIQRLPESPSKSRLWSLYVPESGNFVVAEVTLPLWREHHRLRWRQVLVHYLSWGLCMGGLLGILLYRYYRQKEITNQREIKNREFRALLMNMLNDRIVPEAQQIQTVAQNDAGMEEINRSTWELISLLRNLESLTAIEEGLPTTSNRPILNLKEILNLLIINKSHQARLKRIKIHYTFDPGPICSKGEHYCLKRALENVLDNAVTYSPPDSRILVLARRENETVVIEIADQGPGFTREDEEKLFQRRRILTAAPTGGESQNGIGLFVAYQLLSAMDSRIQLVSTSKNGSLFRITIPGVRDSEKLNQVKV